MAVANVICFFCVSIILMGIPTTSSMEFEGTPSNLTSVVGDTVILTCVIKDKDEDNPVFWQRYDGTSDRLGTLSRDRNTRLYAHFYPDLSPRLQVVGDASRGEYHLLIADLTLEDQGRYVCFFMNDGGFNQYAPITHLTVLPLTGIPGTGVGTSINPSCQATVSMPSQAVTVGTTVMFVCQADGLRDITSLTWYVGRDHSFTNAGSCALSKSPQQRFCTFRRTLTLRDIGKTFRCIAGVDPLEQQGSRGSFSPSCSLQPLKSTVTVSVTPSPNIVLNGETATFYCTTTVDPDEARYKWFLNDEPLQSTTPLLMVSIDDVNDNIIKCVVGNHFGYLGHGDALLIVDHPDGGQNPPPATTVLSTPPTTTKGTDSISEIVHHYVQSNEESVTSVQLSIDDSKLQTNTVNRQIALFPMVMVISLASGAIFLAILLAVVTACVITRKKRGDAGTDAKIVQLETVRPDPGRGHFDKKVTKTKPSRVTPNVKWAPDSSLCNDSKAPNAYAVLDPDNVDNDSLSSLELQDIVNSSEGSPQGGPATRLETNHQQKHMSTNGNPKVPRGRSASTPGGPVVVYPGERKPESYAVAYAVTNIIGDRKWPGVGENNDNVTSSVFYDNNMITNAPGAKGISRKRAMSSPITSQVTNGEQTTSKPYNNPNNINTTSKCNTPRIQFHVDETSTYAEIPELVASVDKDTNGFETNGGAISTVPEPPFPRSYLRSSNAYAVTKVVSPPRVKPRPSSHAE